MLLLPIKGLFAIAIQLNPTPRAGFAFTFLPTAIAAAYFRTETRIRGSGKFQIGVPGRLILLKPEAGEILLCIYIQKDVHPGYLPMAVLVTDLHVCYVIERLAEPISYGVRCAF